MARGMRWLLYPQRNVVGTHGIGGWVGNRVGLDVLETTVSYPCREMNHCSSFVQPVA